MSEQCSHAGCTNSMSERRVRGWALRGDELPAGWSMVKWNPGDGTAVAIFCPAHPPMIPMPVIDDDNEADEAADGGDAFAPVRSTVPITLESLRNAWRNVEWTEIARGGAPPLFRGRQGGPMDPVTINVWSTMAAVDIPTGVFHGAHDGTIDGVRLVLNLLPVGYEVRLGERDPRVVSGVDLDAAAEAQGVFRHPGETDVDLRMRLLACIERDRAMMNPNGAPKQAIAFAWADDVAERRILAYGMQVLRECLPSLPGDEACGLAWESNSLFEHRSLVIRRGPVSADRRFIVSDPRFMQFEIVTYNRDGRPILNDAAYVEHLVRASVQQVMNAR